MIRKVFKKGNSINHPAYYNMHPSKIECIDIVRYHDFNIGNVIKYCWRAGLKKEASEEILAEIKDLKKARWYLDDKIKLLEETKK